ncbi:hypothetical protein ACFL18_00265 [Patescibacteria group bacterium]
MRVLKLCLILLLINSLIYLNRLKFDNQVWFGGDAKEYQTLAVNFAKGYGFMKIGAVAGDYAKDYKFQERVDDIYKPHLDLFIKNGQLGGYYDFYRAPGYPFFLGIIYKVFGVVPKAVQQIQLLLVILVASFLPWLGYFYWKKPGLMAGLASMIIYLQRYARNVLAVTTGITYPNKFMAEPLVTMFLLLYILLFIFWQKKKSLASALALGIITGLNILIKASAIFLPVITVVYLIYFSLKRLKKWPSLIGYIAGVLLIIVPWSFYASKVAGRKIFILTQGVDVILYSHNEFALDGTWHKEGYLGPNIHTSLTLPETKILPFYNRPEIEALPVLKKLLAFYSTYPEYIPKMFLAKIHRGFGRYQYLILGLLLINYGLMLKLLNQMIKKWKIKIRFSLNFILSLLMIVLILPYFKIHIMSALIDKFFRINPQLFGLMILAVINKIVFKKKAVINIPAPFIIIFLSYLLITWATSGIRRLIQVIDFIFILVFFKQVIDFLKTMLQGVEV